MILRKKLIRDLFEHKGANLATILIILIAIMLFAGASKVMFDIKGSKEKFYEECKFPDAYATVISAPINFKSKVDNINGIKLFEGRRTQDVTIKGTHKTIRLVSKTEHLGKYKITKGSDLERNKNEIVIGEKFAKANDYKIGDTLEIVCSGNIVTLKIVGYGRSAENVFEMKDETAIFSDPKEFSIGFIDMSVMQDITGGAHYNEVVFQFDNDKVNFVDVKHNIEKQFKQFGLVSTYPKKDQQSNTVVEGEIKELKTTMVFMPMIFLFVAALVMTIMIKRIITQQRVQIGVLKAFGYSDFKVGVHYASYCILLGLIGGILGGLISPFIAEKFLNIYKDMFNMEFIIKYSYGTYFIAGILLSTIFCAIIGIRVSKQAMKTQPAEAMRQEVPVGGKKSFLERLKLFDFIFSSTGKMAIRNIVRNRKRSIFIVIGLSLSFAITIMPWSLLFMLDSMIFDRYTYVEKYDAKVVTERLLEYRSVEHEVSKLPGINLSEAHLVIPSRINHKGIEEDVSIIGVKPDSKLYQVVDENNKPINISKTGILFSERIADKLGIKVGDKVLFSSPYSKHKDDDREVVVTAIISQTVGMNGYMNIDYLSSTLGYNTVCNNVLVDTDDEEDVNNLSDKYQDSKEVKGVVSKQSTIEQTLVRMDGMYGSIYGMAIIAMIMSFAIVYNIYLVVILERKREFATLLVLGMRERNVLNIVALEQRLLALLGIIIGLPVAKGMLISMSKGLSTDMFSMPSTLNPLAVLISVALMAISIYLAKLLASKKIHTIDLVEALKSGE